MGRSKLTTVSKAIALVVLFISSTAAAFGQTTAFTYQGSLKNGGTPATGNYDFEFALYDAVSGGTQLGSNVQRLNVAVAGGTFSVSLDFGSQFPGADRFLEIRVRSAGGGAFTALSPRQPVNSSPYAIKSLDAQTLGGVTANQYVVTSDPRMTDARQPTAGSANYIQNGTSLQSSANFNIGGTGSANILSSTTQFNLGGARIMATNGNNLIVGNSAGFSNPTGQGNTLVGTSAGQNTTTGQFNSFFGVSSGTSNATANYNSFFGYLAGFKNTTGEDNAFFGREAGRETTEGYVNSFFGSTAGRSNTTGFSNSFFGQAAGYTNSTGNSNSFFGTISGFANTSGFNNAFFGKGSGAANSTGSGNNFFGWNAGSINTLGNLNTFIGRSAGSGNTTGSTNVFIGTNAGENNSIGSSNTLVGNGANVSVGNLNNASAFGANARVSQDNSLVLGSISGIGGATADTNVGIGTTTPGFRLDVVGRIRLRQNTADTGATNTAGIWLFQNTPNQERAFVGMETDSSVGFFGLNGGGWSLVMDTATGRVKVVQLGPAGSQQLCRNASNEISTCSSSARYKDNIIPFTGGLELVRRLRPVSFNWKNGGTADMGLVAEEVNAVEPLLTSANANGEVEGVKYDRVSVVLVNAVKEQQAQIEAQKAEIEILKKKLAEVEELKKLVCAANPTASVCKEER